MRPNHNRKMRVTAPGWWLLACCFSFLCHALSAAETNRFLTLDQILSRWRSVPLDEVKSAAEKGEPSAQHYLGYYHVEGLGGVTNEAEGLRWYTLAAGQNFPNSQNNIGVLYLKGKSIKPDVGVACQWLERAAQQGFPMALRNLAELMRQEKYPRQKAAELRELHEKAAFTGDPDAQLQLGHYLAKPPAGGIHETENAIYWYKKAFAQGRAEACYFIGESLIIYSDDRRKELAALWYQRGAELGDISSQAAVGWISFTGQGVKQDAEKGLRIALELAEKGHVGMMYMLGRYYAGDRLPMPSPIPQDLPKALSWYRKAAEKGHAQAMEMLGQHLLDGTAAKDTEREGAKWLLQAAATGLASAKAKVAELAARRPDLIRDAPGKD